MDDDSRLGRANALYEQAAFGGDADLSLARGRVLHARFLSERQDDPGELALFERAAELYQRLGDVRGESEAAFWVGCFHQVVRGDSDLALPFFERSYQLASQVGDKLTLSYAARHLGFVYAEAGTLDAAREKLDDAGALLDEADAIAVTSGAAGIRRWIAEARAELAEG